MMIENNNLQPPSAKKRANKISKNSRSFNSLPVDSIVEILQWLPVLCLLKCRSVCKLWASVISSPNFIKAHVLKSIEITRFDDRRIIACPLMPPYNRIKDCSLYTLLNKPISNKVIVVDSPIKNPYMMVWVVGCCNGLVCLVDRTDQLFLWNPATRKSKELQKLEMASINIENYKQLKTIYGFGYDEHNNDYKVVGLFSFYSRENGTYMMKVGIYSLRLDRWRGIEDFPSRIVLTPSRDSGKFVNGALHWAAGHESGDSWFIVSLNLTTEEYGEVAQPIYGEGDYSLTLGVVEGSLCVFCNYDKIRADVWVMREYGVPDSWTKLFSIPYGYSIPLCISASGDIVMESNYGIVVYNSKNNRFKDSLVTQFSCHTSHTYIESLVSPNV